MRQTKVLVAGFPPLSSFFMVMFQGICLSVCVKPESPAEDTAFVVNSHFVLASLPVGCQQFSNVVSVATRSNKNRSFT